MLTSSLTLENDIGFEYKGWNCHPQIGGGFFFRETWRIKPSSIPNDVKVTGEERWVFLLHLYRFMEKLIFIQVLSSLIFIRILSWTSLVSVYISILLLTWSSCVSFFALSDASLKITTFGGSRIVSKQCWLLGGYLSQIPFQGELRESLLKVKYTI